MGTPGLTLCALLLANTLHGGELELCVENAAPVDESIVQVFRTELRSILSVSGRTAVFTECQSGVIAITFRQQPPEEETSALGGIRHREGRLIPKIDLFTGPVAKILGSNLPVLVGRALARVATHELGHWLTQSSGHSNCGVMVERLTAAHLMASGRNFFRLPPPTD